VNRRRSACHESVIDRPARHQIDADALATRSDDRTRVLDEPACALDDHAPVDGADQRRGSKVLDGTAVLQEYADNSVDRIVAIRNDRCVIVDGGHKRRSRLSNQHPLERRGYRRNDVGGGAVGQRAACCQINTNTTRCGDRAKIVDDSGGGADPHAVARTAVDLRSGIGSRSVVHRAGADIDAGGAGARNGAVVDHQSGTEDLRAKIAATDQSERIGSGSVVDGACAELNANTKTCVRRRDHAGILHGAGSVDLDAHLGSRDQRRERTILHRAGVEINGT
jgi:hypothetical protein